MSTDRHASYWYVETTIERGDTPFGRILTVDETLAAVSDSLLQDDTKIVITRVVD